MVIEWNRATWYSKLVAIFVFIGFIPVIAFRIGKEYQETKTVIVQAQVAAEAIEFDAGNTELHKTSQEK